MMQRRPFLKLALLSLSLFSYKAVGTKAIAGAGQPVAANRNIPATLDKPRWRTLYSLYDQKLGAAALQSDQFGKYEVQPFFSTLESLDPKNFHSELLDLIAEDFAERRTRSVAGWRLSETETRLHGFIFLTQRQH